MMSPALRFLSLVCLIGGVHETFSAATPTFIGQHTENEGGVYISAVTVKDRWEYDQKTLCSWPKYSKLFYTFGNHQAAFARSRGFVYKGIRTNQSLGHQVVRVDVEKESCQILPTSAQLPFEPGEYWIDFFPDQNKENPRPTFMGALLGSPTNTYVIMRLEAEFSTKPRITMWMNVSIPHPVRQIFGSYYDSESERVYIGFNEGHLFWDVPPSWLYVIDVKNKAIVSQVFNKHLAGFDIWYDTPTKKFYIPTMNDCSKNCTQGVREWVPGERISDVKTEFCHEAACFMFQVGYGYSYNPSNHTGVLYGGVSGYWHYNVQTGALGQYEYDTVFPSNAVYVGPLDGKENWITISDWQRSPWPMTFSIVKIYGSQKRQWPSYNLLLICMPELFTSPHHFQ